MSDVEALVSGDPSEVLRLRGRHTVVRNEPTEEETHVGWSSPKTEKSGDLSAEFR
jgi:hypothetical protein